MNRAIEKQIRFVVENDKEAMLGTLTSGSSEENKKTKWEPISRHDVILVKLDNGKALSHHGSSRRLSPGEAETLSKAQLLPAEGKACSPCLRLALGRQSYC